VKYHTIDRLDVYRYLSDGHKVLVGQLAQNPDAVYFQYDKEYLARYQNLSPFKLPFSGELTKAPTAPHLGLQGVFADLRIPAKLITDSGKC